MKVTLAIIALFITVVCFANMASPYIQGSNNVAPITSRNIDITRELLVITPAKDFETAAFSIDYYIHTDTAGLQIPFLFVAAGYNDSMAITIDDIPVQSQNLLLSHKLDQGKLTFHGFDKLLDTINGQQNVKVTWGDGSATYYSLAELEYFEADITKGTHVIHVEYNAKIDIDRSSWIRSYKCSYHLSPAKYWKSFGGLDVVLDKRNCTKNLSTNLGKPADDAGNVTKWHFSSLPADVLQINYNPTLPGFAAMLIAISPLGLALIASIILMVLQVWLMQKYRYNKFNYRLVYYLGTIAIPIFFYVCYFNAYDLIDAVIGDDAAKFHGYVFLLAITYVLVAPVYAGIMYLISNGIKPKTAAKNTSA